MKLLRRSLRLAALGALALVSAASPAQASSIILDGTFQNSIGTGLTLTPWSDWINAGITREAAPSHLSGNAAVLPMYSDLFQRFVGPEPGMYRLSFSAKNASPNAAQLVTSVQNPGGGWGWVSILKVIDFEANSDWSDFQFDFEITNPTGTPSEFYFSNSYNAPDPAWGLENSVNPPGTVFKVASVSISRVPEPTPVPEPGAALWLLATAAGALAYGRRRLA